MAGGSLELRGAENSRPSCWPAIGDLHRGGLGEVEERAGRDATTCKTARAVSLAQATGPHRT